MAAQTSNSQMLAAKKLVAMALLVIGLLLVAGGISYSSTPMTVVGVIALVAGVALLAWKIKARNDRL